MKANYISPSCELFEVIASASICEATSLTSPEIPVGGPWAPARKLYI